ncbi:MULTISPECIES: DMT family transporter [Heyndrickxia]|uniref:DMT family transporter n=1 Tax=Heyndrickxia TaxID=2837504 RepID=UPI001B0C6ABC|nr:multidrug efflux SMR transporter [Heyndrickxia oleronia]GIN39260.1 QacE family quaternary ammonium compound efflux SMR transporter [Heyndrickxia oleronia]
MAWFYLILGGIFEVGWALGLKYSNGFTNITALIPTLVLLILSFWCFAKTLVILPVSTAYAVFTGLGAFGTAIVGMTLLGDPVNVIKVVLVLVLISCIIGLKLVSNETETKSGD